MALAGILELEWHEANQPKRIHIQLLNEDGSPVSIPTPTGDRPFEIEANVEVGRPPGTRPGTSFNVPIAINLPPLPIRPGGHYVWRFTIADEAHDDWRLPFSTRSAETASPRPRG
jgi:hypothetical protein